MYENSPVCSPFPIIVVVAVVVVPFVVWSVCCLCALVCLRWDDDVDWR